MHVLYLGRNPCTKETLPDYLKWRRVTRPPLVFRGLTGSQRTPGFRASQLMLGPIVFIDGFMTYNNKISINMNISSCLLKELDMRFTFSCLPSISHTSFIFSFPSF